MLIRLGESTHTALGFMASGKLTDNDYKNFLIPEVKAAIHDNGQIRLLFQMDDFHGWEWQAAWDDLTFGLQINQHVERIAIVGDQRWESWMTRLMKPFTHGEVRYYDADDLTAAWSWIKQETLPH